MKFLATFGAVVIVLGLAAFLSILPAALWFCFDDTLARVTGTPELDGLSFWQVYAFTLFLSLIFKSSNTNNCKKD